MDLRPALLAFWQKRLPESAIAPPLTADDFIIVAVSGGADSLALLHALLAQRPHPSEKLIVAHLNHGWRETAVVEAEFVAQTAQAWGVACVVGAADAPALARKRGLSLEEASREARYAFLRQTAAQYNARFIMTAHQADDQAETVLHNLLRGGGLTGLRGMLPVNRLSHQPPLWLLRPLLDVPRAAVDEYCEAHNLQPVDDPSNWDGRFRRNQLRHELLPILREYNPNISQQLRRLAAVAAAEVAFLEEAADEIYAQALIASGGGWLRLDRAAWQAAPLALRRRLLRTAVSQLAPQPVEIGFLTVEQARQVAESGDVGAQSVLPGGVVLTVGYGVLNFAVGETAVPFHAPQLPADQPIPLPIPGRVPLAGDWQITAELATTADLETIRGNSDPWRAYLDRDKVGALVVRGRWPGERFDPLGMGGRTTPLKELMINDKIPAPQRARWPLVADERGAVWLSGHKVAERAKVTAETTAIICLRIS